MGALNIAVMLDGIQSRLTQAAPSVGANLVEMPCLIGYLILIV
jgi:ACR3 family arsenite efflux pump ArsB